MRRAIVRPRHESTHGTRHVSRFDRDLGRKRFGDEGYAREELVAQLGAAFLCADLGLWLEDRQITPPTSRLGKSSRTTSAQSSQLLRMCSARPITCTASGVTYRASNEAALFLAG